MKSPLFAALAALAVGSAAAVSTFSQAADAPTRIGFIDMKKAYDTYRKRVDLTESLNAKSKTMFDQLKKRDNAIQDLAGTLNTMNPDNPKYAQTQREVTLSNYELEYDKKAARASLEEESRKLFGSVYKEICQEAEAYGAENGYAAILLYLPPDFDFGSNIDLFSSTRAVLCRDTSLDVTEKVVGRLNGQLPPPAVKAPPVEPKKEEQPKKEDEKKDEHK